MRAIWKGAISFGLIHIPIRLYSASKSRELKFRLLHNKDFSEIRYARICKADGREVPWEEIVKGYEYKSGDYVVLADEDFERANLKKSKSVEILDFVNEADIDSIYYEAPYYLEPQKGAESAYVLLREALRRSKKVAVGSFVLRLKEHLGVIKPYQDVLVLNQLRYAEELASADELNIPSKKQVKKTELDIAIKFIEQLTKPFKPDNYVDTYTEEMMQIINQKAKGLKVKAPRAAREPKTQDIMELLKESLKQTRKRKAA